MIQFQVLQGLSSELCMMRKLRNVYETNRAFKAAALYTWICNETTSGQISLDKDNRHKIASELGISESAIYGYIRYAQEENLLQYHKKNRTLRITSINTICKQYLLDRQFITIEINPDKTRLEYAIKALEYREAQERMQKGLQAKVRNNPSVKAAYMYEASKQGYNVKDFDLHGLSSLQKQVFAAGGSETTYDTLFIPNPDLNRNLHTIASRRKMKSHVSAHYERNRLAKLNLISVKERQDVQCRYQGKPQEGCVKGRVKNRRRIYDAARGHALWKLPHSIEVSPSLISVKQIAANPRQNDVL